MGMRVDEARHDTRTPRVVRRQLRLVGQVALRTRPGDAAGPNDDCGWPVDRLTGHGEQPTDASPKQVTTVGHAVIMPPPVRSGQCATPACAGRGSRPGTVAR